MHTPKWLLAILGIGTGFVALYLVWGQDFMANDRGLDKPHPEPPTSAS